MENSAGDSVAGLASWGRTGILVAAAAISLTGLLLSWISRRRSALRQQSLRLPPGPKGWPIIGALPHLKGMPHRSLFELAKTYGPLMYMKLGSVSLLVVSNGAMGREVLQTNDQLFASRPRLLVPIVLTNGQQDIVWAPNGHLWRRLRKIATLQLLTSSKLSHFMGFMKDEILSTIHIMLEQSQRGGSAKVNAGAVFNGMMMNILTQMMWHKRYRNLNVNGSQNSDIDDTKFENLIKIRLALAGSNNIADFMPSFMKLFTMRLSGLDKKARDAQKELDEFIESIIREREQALRIKTKPATDKDDFVDVMLKLRSKPEDSEGLSRQDMKALLTDMVVAGTDTTSITLEWILSEILRNSHIMKKAQDELMAVVGEDRLVTESDIPNLKYLDAVVKEGLRKYSAGPLGIPHLATADCKVGGYDVPANTTVFINHFAIHHDPEVWENPTEFNPERFLHSDMDYRGQTFEYIPFSSGRRMCPGLNLASTALHLSVAQFLHTMHLSLPEGQTPESLDMTETAGRTLARATPLFVTAKPRLANHVIYPVTA